MDRPRVLVDAGPGAADPDWRRLGGVAEVVRVTEERDEAGLIADLAGFAGLIAQGGRLPPLTESLFRACPELRIVGVRGDRFGAGVDLPAAHRHGVCVVDTDNIASAPPVAEWDLAMMLICLRNAGAVYRQMMAGTETWAVAGNQDFVHGELTGKRVGLVGCGHVGQRLIELLAPFRVDLLVSDPYLDEEVAGGLGIRRGSLGEVLDHADILVVQVPHTPKTEGLIGAAELERLGDGRILVNCSRGKVIDHEALVTRLQTGRLIAGLDVFDPEPLPADSVLRRLPNVFCTPHIAWYAPHVFHRYFGSLVDEFVRFFSGRQLRYELTRRMVDIRHGRL